MSSSLGPHMIARLIDEDMLELDYSHIPQL